MFCRLAKTARKTLFSCIQQQQQQAQQAQQSRPSLVRTYHTGSVHSSTTTIAAYSGTASGSSSSKKKRVYSTAAETEEMAAPINTTDRLSQLRELMSMAEHNVAAYVVPSEDAHQSEYVASCDERRAFISGFDGSAGCAVVTAKEALLFTDGRYFLQARQQMDSNWTLMKSGLPGVPTWQEYVGGLATGSRVGIDPTLVSATQALELRKKMQAKGVQLVSVADNLVDRVWGSRRPERPLDEIFVHDVKFAGASHADKVARVRAAAAKAGADGVVVAALDEVAWLLNLRGSDISYNPVFFAYVLVTADGVTLFADERKVPDAVRAHLQGVQLQPYGAVFSAMRVAAAGRSRLLAGASASWALAQALEDAGAAVLPESPLPMLKAIKTQAELDGMRSCHVRDGAAMAQFLAWLENELRFNAGHLRLSECDVADKLESLRRAQPQCVGLSFATISAVGANGAIIHYSPTRGSDALLDVSQMFLCDSGGQYRDGTTDVTRTCHFGSPSPWQRECFTRVLKGHIALDRAVFPAGTSGFVLDPLARLPLWELGLDFRHGTGHGVGSFLNVHEGPQGVGMRRNYLDAGFQHGMTITNEPGYYEDGSFGIRIENTCLVVKKQTPFDYTGGPGFLTFEPVTMVPIQKSLVQVGLLTPDERAWLDAYHANVWASVSPLLEEGSLAYEWLKRETSPI